MKLIDISSLASLLPTRATCALARRLRMDFPESYPVEPPIVYFTPPVFHINVFENGQICMSLLYADKDWRPNISIPQLLLGVQELVRPRALGDDVRQCVLSR